MGQAKEAGEMGGGCLCWFPLFPGQEEKGECESLALGSLTSLGDTFTEKEQQQHTRFRQIILKREK